MKNLLSLIDEYGIYFVEPVNRLATLYFLKGKFLTSYKLCQLVLWIKPYHVGALSGIIQVCLGMKEPASALVNAWAKRLPDTLNSLSTSDGNSFSISSFFMVSIVSFSSIFPAVDKKDVATSELRDWWVDAAVAIAEERLRESDRRTEDFFGKSETYNSQDAAFPFVNDNIWDSGVSEGGGDGDGDGDDVDGGIEGPAWQ